MPQFSEFNLLEPIQKALIETGYTTPTPIQERAIPPLLEDRDLLGIAQTGTGKTAAFAVPILNRLASHPRRLGSYCCRCLILTPTRELAAQIQKSFETYGKHLDLSSTVIFGGVNQNPQVKAMNRGQDVLVATPGRLLDLMKQRKVVLDQLEVFVLDEADRMLDMGFIHDVRKVIAKLPPKRQTLLFSATMPKDIADLAGSLLKNPVKVAVTPESTTVEKIDQRVLFVDKKNKPNLLKHLLDTEGIDQALVFTRTKHGANKVSQALTKWGIQTAAIHGNKSQAARVKALEGFKDKKLRVLVATDIAARGIDIPGLSYVFNFDLPEVPESYVHRIGRTARAGKTGAAYAFCDIGERGLLRQVQKNIRMEIPVMDGHPYQPTPGQQEPTETTSNRGAPKRGRSSGTRGGSAGGRTDGRRAQSTTQKKASTTSGRPGPKRADSARSAPSPAAASSRPAKSSRPSASSESAGASADASKKPSARRFFARKKTAKAGATKSYRRP